MRMWMVDPKLLCRKHLLGEHNEIHKHRHNFVKHHSIAGRKGQIDPAKMEERHNALVIEMREREYNHKSPYEQPDLSYYDLDGFIVDTNVSLQDLSERCVECAERIENANIKIKMCS